MRMPATSHLPAETVSHRRADRAAAGGRHPFPSHLKRERIVHDLAEADKHCADYGQDLRHIGEEVSEHYEYILAHMLVVENACQKYACSCTVKTAVKPAAPV